MIDGSNNSLRCRELEFLRNISRTSAARAGKGLSCLSVPILHAQLSSRTEADHQLEYETLRCIKQILNSGVCLRACLRALVDVAPARCTGRSHTQPPHYANRVFVELTSLGYQKTCGRSLDFLGLSYT